MDLRQRIIWGIGFAILCIGGIVGLVVFLSDDDGNQDLPDETATTTDEGIAAVPAQEAPEDVSFVPVTLPPRQIETVIEDDTQYEEARYVVQLAKIFTERFGSFSSQNSNQHLRDAQQLATERMSNWIATQATSQAADYRGVTSRVVASELLSFEENSASVQISYREEQRIGNEKEASNQDVRVELVKVGEEWKVDGFYR